MKSRRPRKAGPRDVGSRTLNHPDDPTIEEDIEAPRHASVDARAHHEPNVGAGVTDGAVSHTAVTANDAATERPEDDGASRSPSAREGRGAGDRPLRVVSPAPADTRAVLGDPAAIRSHLDPSAVIIVADSVRAQFYVAAGAAAPLREVASLLNPEGRAHERDLVADAAGRRGHQPAQSGASAFGGESAKAHRAEEFAARVCEYATETLDHRPSVRIHIVSEPRFLGLLRRRMTGRMQRQVMSEVPKSLVGRPVQEIRAALPAHL